MYFNSKNKSYEKIRKRVDEDLLHRSQSKAFVKYFRNQHKYILSNSDIGVLFSKKLYKDIINSIAFKRLKDIRFLGAIDYVILPSNLKSIRRHTRFQHSLCVARLVLQHAIDVGMNDKEEELCVAAALLHDIGHAPLSHSLESVFKNEFDIGHHLAGERIIKGEVEVGEKLHHIICDAGINPYELLSIISGKGLTPFREIFSYSINADTIEGILRSVTYMKGDMISYTPSDVMMALTDVVIGNSNREEYTNILDAFWELKDLVYSKFINSILGVQADYIAQYYMRKNQNKFKNEYFYGSESKLIEKHPELFDALLSGDSVVNIFDSDRLIECNKRKFIINADVSINNVRDLDARYTQTKEIVTLKLSKKGCIDDLNLGGAQGNISLLR